MSRLGADPARAELAAFAVLGLAALVAALLVPTYPNYDSYYALVWGRELLDGSSPSFEAYSAPTQHPLWNVVGALLGAVFGDDADRAIVVGCAVGHVALCWGTFRLGTVLANRAVGAVAAVLVGSSFAFLLFAARGYVDVPFLALVVWAGALEAGGRHGPGRPMVLLVLAGLLRPEAWVLAGLLWLWHAAGPWVRERGARGAGAAGGARADGGADAPPGHVGWTGSARRGVTEETPGHGETTASATAPPAGAPRAASVSAVGLATLRPGLLAGVLAAPLLWALSDLLVTSDPLFSLNSTSALAEALGRDRGIGAVPSNFVSFLSDTARPPVAAAGALGALLAWRARGALGLRGLHVLAALFGAGAVTFAGVGVAGLSILPRYLTVPVVALCVLAALVLAGWTLLAPDHPRRRSWMIAAIAGAAVGALGFAVVKNDAPGRFATELRYLRAVHDDLEAVLAVPAVREARRCGPVSLPNYRLTPDTRWVLDAGEDAVVARSDPDATARAARGGVALVAVGEKNVRRIGRADGTPRATNAAPPGFTEAARNRTFVAHVRC